MFGPPCRVDTTGRGIKFPTIDAGWVNENGGANLAFAILALQMWRGRSRFIRLFAGLRSPRSGDSCLSAPLPQTVKNSTGFACARSRGRLRHISQPSVTVFLRLYSPDPRHRRGGRNCSFRGVPDSRVGPLSGGSAARRGGSPPQEFRRCRANEPSHPSGGPPMAPSTGWNVRTVSQSGQ